VWGNPELWLVLASLSLLALTSVSAHDLSGDLRGRHKSRWMIAGMVAAGVFICSLHVAGMLAVDQLAIIITACSLCGLACMMLASRYMRSLRRRGGRLHESLHRANSELEFLLLHDALTRLPNRMLLADRLDQAIAQSKRISLPCAVLFLDIDRFKAINDAVGRTAADAALQEIGRRTVRALRKNDTVARVGGDQFAVVLPQLTQGINVGILAARLLREIAEPYALDERVLHLSASIGVAMYPNDGDDAETLLGNADAAMYYAKKEGRANYQFFSNEMNVFDRERAEMEAGLRAALLHGQFELHYQPKVEVRSGAIRSVEALVRWRHPEKGLISPAQFIPLAEETGLILPIGKWILREACRQCRAWHADGETTPLRVAVNISAMQFRDPELGRSVARILEETGLEPQFLELELTESTVMAHAEKAEQSLRALSELGVQISIDDFGTGYSSLAYLKRFPLNTLKVDRAFVNDLGRSNDDLAIVRAIISLAHSLRLKVIAEGVESDEQLDVLRDLHCDEYQGYLCSKPLPAAELASILAERAPAQDAAAA
jgi:diguanylate cyclase